MRFSVIIAAFNEGGSLGRSVESSLESVGNGGKASDFEVIVADDGSWDGSVEETAARFPQVRVVSHPPSPRPSPEEREAAGTSPTKHLGAHMRKATCSSFWMVIASRRGGAVAAG